MSKEALDFFKGNKQAADIWLRKYARKEKGEISPLQMFERISRELNRKEYERNENFDGYDDTKKLENLSAYGKERFANYFTDEIKSKDLSKYISFDAITLGGSGNEGLGAPELYSSLSNCLVLGQPYDSISGIFKKRAEMAFAFQRRMGAGLDISTLRPKNAKLNNQAKHSSGAVSFANGFSETTKEIAQDARRGALMLSMNILHPDSFEFITSKIDKTKITGANISLLIDDEFMQAAIENKEILLRFPVDLDVSDLNIENFELDVLTEVAKGKYIRRVSAKTYWDKLIECAHASAEPGVIFIGNWKRGGLDWAYPQYRPVTTNPCSEIPMPEYDACRLLAYNLYSFVENPFTSHARFVSNEKMYEIFYEQMVIGDIIIDLEIEYLERIVDKITKSETPQEEKEMEISFFNKIISTTKKSRRVGCGFTGLADMLAAMSLAYYSPVAIQEIFHMKMKAELDATIDMAVMFGTFDSFDFELENENEYMRMIEKEFPKQYERMKIYGRRNVSMSTAAPTGTTSMMTQTTSGIEPLFKPYYIRRVKCNTEKDRVDFIDADGQKFTNHFVLHPKLIDFAENSDLVPHATREELETMEESKLNELYIKKSPWFGNCADDLNWQQRVEIQSIVQRYTTHAISSTINLPEDVSTDKISEIYIESWRKGLKGNTVYREGSRGGILVSTKNANKKDEENFDDLYQQFLSLCEKQDLQDSEIEQMFKEMPAQKRPKTLNAELHTFKSRNKIYTIVIGLLNYRPFEIFVLSDVVNLCEDIHTQGTITKNENNEYDFEETGGIFEIKNLGNMEQDEKLISLLISSSLRHRAPIEYVQKVIEKSEPIAGTFAHRLNKILSSYITSEKSIKEICVSCGGEIVRENGCFICKSCGASKC